MSKERKTEQRGRGAEHRVREARGFNRVSGAVNGLCRRALSSVRLSLSFRISIHYALQLMRTWLREILLVSLVFCAVSGTLLYAEARRALTEEGGYDRRTRAVQVQTEEGAEKPATDTLSLFKLSASETLRTEPHRSVVFALADETGQVWLVRIATEGLWLLLAALLGAVTVSDLFRMGYFVAHNHRLDKRVLAPIREMTEQAEALSAANLSDRLNVAGTKNELRDLAVVINRMLDRIELSYNSQKQFVSDASHELRTPIAVIQGYADMLRRWGKDDKEVLDESVSAISSEAASMKELVDNLLFLARHDKKSLMMEMVETDVAELTREVARETAMVQPKDVIEVHADAPVRITCDRSLIKQALRILTDNAVKYPPEGGTVTLSAEATPAGCALSVRDTGSGIAPKDLPKIFERFYRSDAARKQVNGGHGLGLSIARIIVVAHRGTIQVRSKPGEGSVFRILLPAGQQADPAPRAAEIPEAAPPKKEKARRAS